jgi:hypothetical protein
MSLSKLAAVALLLLAAALGCAKGNAPTQDECVALTRKVAELSVLIANMATTDEEIETAVRKSAAIATVAAELGCPILLEPGVVDSSPTVF